MTRLCGSSSSLSWEKYPIFTVLPPDHLAAVRRHQATEQLYQRAFSAAVFAYDADAVARQYDIGKISDQHSIPIGLGNVPSLQRLSAQPGFQRLYRQHFLPGRAALVFQRFDALDTLPALGASGPRAALQPGQLTLKQALPLPFTGRALSSRSLFSCKNPS